MACKIYFKTLETSTSSNLDELTKLFLPHNEHLETKTIVIHPKRIVSPSAERIVPKMQHAHRILHPRGVKTIRNIVSLKIVVDSKTWRGKIRCRRVRSFVFTLTCDRQCRFTYWSSILYGFSSCYRP
jgi:hypothetical protein